MKFMNIMSRFGYHDEVEGDGGDGGGGLPAADDAKAVADAIADGNVDDGQAKEWFLTEDVKGSGEVPEWFKSDKYKSVGEQAKAYGELEKRFGGFTGAPEEYETNISDELKESGVEIADDDAIMTSAKEFAKEAGMNQESFDKMIDLYAMGQLAQSKVNEEARGEEFKLLGDNAQGRIQNLNDWASRNMPEDMVEGFQEMAISANAVKAMERMISMTRGVGLTPKDADPAGDVSSEEVRKMQFEKDEHGNRRINTDPEFRSRYNKLKLQAWGAEEHRVKIG